MICVGTWGATIPGVERGSWLRMAIDDADFLFCPPTLLMPNGARGGAARADEGRGALYTQTLATVLQSKRKKCNRAVTVP